ncbi:hypothetical protein Q9R29_11790 [Rothia sp. ARF10]|nr:hypothetical protein [Rothia sp. ARF10]
MSHLPRSLARLARDHRGLVTRRLALAAHVTPGVLEASVRSGGLHRIRPGLLVESSVWEAAPSHERYKLTVRGVLLDRPQWLASHHAALALLGLPLFAVDTSVVDVVAAVRTSKRRTGHHVHVATAAQRALISHPTATSVSVPDACVLTAVGSGVEAGVVAMDAALQRGMTTVSALSQSVAELGVRYRTGHAHGAIAAVDPSCESPGETRTRLILVGAGFDVRSQVSLSDADGFIGRVDFLVGERVVVEFDGAVKYDGMEGRRALMQEKRREDRLRAAGYRVVRVTWRDLDRPEALTARVRGLLAAA